MVLKMFLSKVMNEGAILSTVYDVLNFNLTFAIEAMSRHFFKKF